MGALNDPTLLNAEWLEPDGLGGFASGTVGLARTRRYHALLLIATEPPTGRFVLANGLEAWVTTPNGSWPISTQRYALNTVHPDGWRRIVDFNLDPWPTWTFQLEDGTRIVHELLVPHEQAAVAMRWRLAEPREGVSLHVRPLMSGRDQHAMHVENPAFNAQAKVDGEQVVWEPYPGVPAVQATVNGKYVPQLFWYRNFLYTRETERGLDDVEDLASPGEFGFDLSESEAVMILNAATPEDCAPPRGNAGAIFATFAKNERKRRGCAQSSGAQSSLERAADAYIVRRGTGKTIIAGYPWFTDWGRDTFIAMRGLCLATGRLDEARQILLAWAPTVSQGMLPNRFVEVGGEPEFNSVDASLWFIIAVHDYLRACDASKSTAASDRKILTSAVEAILSGYAGGTRYGIRATIDGLLAAGEHGVQLTWMDAKAGDWVVTPRTGKPVEVQALWLNALSIGASLNPPTAERWTRILKHGKRAFAERFWNDADGCLYDVIDVDHVAGELDDLLRPNQIFAVGGLPMMLVDIDRGRRIVDAVEARLLTPSGLRSLAPSEPGYSATYLGGLRQRDGAYHQGTVWQWLMGPFVEAWVRVRGNTPEAKAEARERFVAPLYPQMQRFGLGHLAEIADADPPHVPRGCPWQAWSLGELLRLEKGVLFK